ncbi:MAG: 2-oxoglutarate/2-oxoacid ferredoxin oxidoreductase, gamma subunit / 2-oxoglutarate/2-oxoacid ferredoxin oxidoreductase, alpha subunit, partial [uncultured Nocardioides sp.]
PRDEPRTAVAAPARHVPRRCHRLQRGARSPAQGRRAGRRHRRARLGGRGHRGRPDTHHLDRGGDLV